MAQEHLLATFQPSELGGGIASLALCVWEYITGCDLGSTVAVDDLAATQANVLRQRVSQPIWRVGR